MGGEVLGLGLRDRLKQPISMPGKKLSVFVSPRAWKEDDRERVMG